MSMDSSVFPFVHIALTAAITAGLAMLFLVALRARFKALSFADCLLVALVVGCSVLVWRSAGNTGALNNDPIPAVSPNDVLCPLVTYLFVGWYAAFRRPVDAVRFEQARVLLTLVSLYSKLRTSPFDTGSEQAIDLLYERVEHARERLSAPPGSTD